MFYLKKLDYYYKDGDISGLKFGNSRIYQISQWKDVGFTSSYNLKYPFRFLILDHPVPMKSAGAWIEK